MSDNVEMQGLEFKIINDSKAANESLDDLTKTLRRLGDATKNGESGLEKTSRGLQNVARSSSRLLSAFSFAKFFAIYHTGKKSIGKLISASAEYTENMNLFTVAMGEYADKAKAFADKASSVLGLDPSDWVRNQGIFQTLLTGFGDSADRAAIMSQNLTQLGYDLSSFFNIPVSDAMQKLQSGISGELEPLRRLGYDLSQTRLEQEAVTLGIQKNVSAMNQAEKAELRYHAILTQVTTAQGDLARTLDDPANQMRVMQAEIAQTTRALGDLFIPILNNVLPYLIAFARALREILTYLGAFGRAGGTKETSFVTKSISQNTKAIAGYVDDAANGFKAATKAAKSLLNYTMAIDELNVISPPASGGSGGGGSGGGGGSDIGGGGGFDFDLPTYDFFEGLVDTQVDEIMKKLRPMIDWIKKNLKTIKKLVIAIGAGLLMWKLTKTFTGDLLTMSQLLGTFTFTAGVTLLLENFDAIASGEYTITSLQGIITTALGGALTSAGFGLVVGASAGTLAIMIPVGAVLSLLITDVVVNFDDYRSIAADLGGIVSGIVNGDDAGTNSSFNSLIATYLTSDSLGTSLFQSLMSRMYTDTEQGQILAMANTGNLDFSKLLEQIKEDVSGFFSSFFTGAVDDISSFFGPVVEAISSPFVSAWESIKGAWATVSTWFDTNVTQPVGGFFKKLGGQITKFFNDPIGSIRKMWATVSTWFDKNITQPIGGFFKKLGGQITKFFNDPIGSIRKMWKTVSTWFDKNIIQPVGGFFKKLGEDIGKFFTKPIETIKRTWLSIVSWFNTNIVDPIRNAFQSIIPSSHGQKLKVVDAREYGTTSTMQDYSHAFGYAVASINSKNTTLNKSMTDADEDIVKAIYDTSSQIVTAIERNRPFVSIGDDTIGRANKRFEQKTGNNHVKGAFAYVR